MGIFSILKKTETVYFTGCIAYYKFREEYDLWKDIFLKLGIDFKVIDKKICCGLPALEAGYDYEARKLARRNFEILKEEKIKKLIAPCPLCHKMFSIEYKKFLPDWSIEIINIWEVILDKLKEKNGLIKNRANEEAGFQDSCYLGRGLKIYNEPREILNLIGYQIKELSDNKENCLCSGGCGGFPRLNPAIADKAAKEKLLQFKRAGIKKLIVCSLEEYELLNKNSHDTGIKVVLFSEILGEALGISRKGIKEEIQNE